MEITAAMCKELRTTTGAGMMDCKNALVEADGDMNNAVDVLRTKGLADMAKKSGRATNEGVIGSYIHGVGRIGVLIEVNCETDFVARNENFQAFVRDIAMHVAAAAPMVVRREDVPVDVLEHEKTIYMAQAAESGKPEAIQAKIAEGRVEKFYKEVCLLEQPYVKNPDITVEQFVGETVGKLGENLKVARFTRYAVGETGA